MKKIRLNDLHVWQFENLGKAQAIKHFITDRNSFSNGKEFTLSYSSSPYPEEIKRNRSLIAGSLDISESRLYLPSQVHKTNIVHVTGQTQKEELMDTDALITNEKAICIAVMSADCVPVLLYDTKHHAVGAVHSGWRGTVAKILAATLQKMKAAFGTHGEDLVAGIGPSVSQHAYEVGEEVVKEVHRAFGKDNELLLLQGNGKARFDLWKANLLQLRQFGVPESHVEISELCTVRNNEDFFSARKGDKGRFAAGIMLV